MSDAPTWYDLLDVPCDASTEEVRAAWKGHIADLEPGDRRFDSLTRAAKVLLDPVSRAAYDATLAAPWDADALLLDEDAPAPVTKPAEAATAEMTGRYRTEYDKLFVVIEENAPQTETKVGAEVVASGIVRAADDRVQVLVFVDRPTTNKLSAEPTVYKDQVTLSMQLVDDVWLVDDMVTSPVQG